MANIDKKDSLEPQGNKFKDWLNSLKDSILPGKNKEKEQLHKETSHASESLKSRVINEALDNLELNMKKGLKFKEGDNNTKAELHEFFQEGKKEFFDSNKTHEERNFVRKYKKIESRPVDVQKGIKESAEDITNEISNWKKEKNPVARSLLRIADLIMGTEK